METLADFDTGGGVLHGHLPWLVEFLNWVSAGIDLAAIALLVVGAARFIGGVAWAEAVGRGSDRVGRMNRERIALGRYILAGLELFIVSDVIHTALSLRFADLVFLFLLVLIRSIVSYFLERELEALKKEMEHG